MSETFRYPIKNIGPYDDYFKIQVLEYKAPGLTLAGNFIQNTSEEVIQPPGSVITSLATVILPMPQQIQDNNATDWTPGTMNPVQSALTSAASGAINAGSPIDFFKSLNGSLGRIFNNISDQVKTAEGQAAISGGIAQAAANAVLGQGDINQTISRAAGVVFNQNVELLFNGVNLRPAYNFTFDMVPRSQQESDTIKKIIRTFKKNMSAQRTGARDEGGGLFVKAPNVFKLEYLSGGKSHPFLHKFKICALTQMNVNYTGSGQYATYSDATPVHIQMTLQFQELSPVYSGDYDTPQGKLGVGY